MEVISPFLSAEISETLKHARVKCRRNYVPSSLESITFVKFTRADSELNMHFIPSEAFMRLGYCASESIKIPQRYGAQFHCKNERVLTFPIIWFFLSWKVTKKAFPSVRPTFRPLFNQGIVMYYMLPGKGKLEQWSHAPNMMSAIFHRSSDWLATLLFLSKGRKNIDRQ